MSDQDIRNTFAIGGLALGFYFGNPALGYLVGSAIGSHIAGPIDGGEGPRLEDLNAVSADYGAPLPRVWAGAYRVPGNPIWAAPLREIEHKETVGDSFLSSGTTITTYTYEGSFAVAVHDGPILGVRRIWANGKLVYDRRSADAYESLIRKTIKVTFLNSYNYDYFITIGGAEFTAADLPALAALIETSRPELRATARNGNAIEIQAREHGHVFNVGSAYSRDESLAIAQPRSIVTGDGGATRNAALAQSDRFEGNIEVYLGSETQEPDPIIESYEGAGNVPAFRGTAYIVFRNLPLGNYGNAIPQIAAEVVVSGGANGETVNAYRAHLLGGLQLGAVGGQPTGDPINTVVEYNDNVSDASSGWTTNKDEVLARVNASRPSYSQLRYFVGFTLAGVGSSLSLRDARQKSSFELSRHAKATLFYAHDPVSGYVPTTDPCDPRIGTEWTYTQDGHLRRVVPPGEPVTGTQYSCGTEKREWKTLTGSIIVRIRPRVPPSTCSSSDPCNPTDSIGVIPGTGGAWCVSCGGAVIRNMVWSETAGSFRTLRALTYGDSLNQIIKWRAAGPVVPVGDPRYDDQDFWVGAADALNIPGDYGVDWPVTVTDCVTASYADGWLEATPTSLSATVAAICEASGLAASEYDVSALVGAVHGYASARPAPGRSLLEPLALMFDFDVRDSDGVAVFVPRGGAVVDTLGPDEIGATVGGDPASLMKISRTEDSELPRSVDVRYADLQRDYQPNTQRAARQFGGNQSASVSLPIAATNEQMSALAERLLWRAWAERDSVELSTIGARVALEPADVIVANDGQSSRELRVLRRAFAAGLVRLSCVSQDAAVFGLSRPAQAGLVSGSLTVAFAGPSSLTFVDSALARDSDDTPGAYAAIAGTGDAWGGAAIYRSLDAGLTWSLATVTTTRGALLRCVSTLPDRSPTLVWRSDTLDVVILSGDFVPLSVTESDFMGGENLAFVGQAGRWELIAWQTAQQIDAITWRLSGLRRGLRGTDWASALHEAEDLLLPVSHLVRLGADLSSVGQPRRLRPVTLGLSLSEAPTLTETLTGESLRPLSPCHVRGSRNTAGDLTVRWLRRTRIGGDWLDDADAAIGESGLHFEVDVLDSLGSVVRTLSVQNMLLVPAFATYTAADQVVDFGAAQASVRVVIYQLSDVVGRGHPVEVTL